MLEESLNTAIGQIYDAAVESDAIPRVLRCLQQLTRSSIGVLSFHDEHTIVNQVANGLDPSFDPGIRAHQHQNLWFIRRRMIPIGHAALGTTLAQPDEWKGVELFEDFLRPAGCVHLLGLVIRSEPGSFVTLSLHRSASDEPYGPGELRVANALAGHLARSFQIGSCLESQERQSARLGQLVDALALPCFLVDEAGHLLFANSEGEAFLRTGKPLRVRHGALAAGTGVDSQKWMALLQRLSGRSGPRAGSAVTLGETSDHRACLLATPLSCELAERLGWVQSQEDNVGLVVVDLLKKRPATNARRFRELFALTPSEALLLEALSSGEEIRTYADRKCLSLNTVKTHLTSVFAKTGTNRQSALVHMVAGLSVLKH